MGMLWTVWPLDAATKSWLDEMGMTYPNRTSRFPTGGEIKDVLNKLSDYQVTIVEDRGLGGAWQALIEHHEGEEAPRTRLNITQYTGDHEPQQLWFDHGSEQLIEQILKNLSVLCGPLLLIPDIGVKPTLITSDT